MTLSKEQLDEQIESQQGHTEIAVYVAARMSGKTPDSAATATVSFVEDAKRSWIDRTYPTRRELYATIERTLLADLGDDA